MFSTAPVLLRNSITVIPSAGSMVNCGLRKGACVAGTAPGAGAGLGVDAEEDGSATERAVDTLGKAAVLTETWPDMMTP